jgi:hypothetical protein
MASIRIEARRSKAFLVIIPRGRPQVLSIQTASGKELAVGRSGAFLVECIAH